MDYFVIKYWRELLIVALAIGFSLSVKQCSRNSDDVLVLKNVNSKSFNEAKYYKNKANELVCQVNTHKLTIDQLKNYGDQLGFKVSELQKRVGNANRLVAHWKGKAGMRDTILVTLRDTVIAENDSINDAEYAFEWSNKFLTQTGIINEGTISIAYNYDTKFSLTAYRKKTGLFKSQLVTDINFEDPNMKVSEFKGFVIQEPKKRFYEKGLFKVAVGFALGIAISSKF